VPTLPHLRLNGSAGQYLLFRRNKSYRPASSPSWKVDRKVAVGDRLPKALMRKTDLKETDRHRRAEHASGRNGNQPNGIPPVSSCDHRWPWIAARNNRSICVPRGSDSPAHDQSGPRSPCEATTTPSAETTSRTRAWLQPFHRPDTRNATIRTGSSALPRHHRFDVEFSRMTSPR
jgi:hypothetical protein